MADWMPTDDVIKDALKQAGYIWGSKHFAEERLIGMLYVRKLVEELEEIWETRCKGNRESFGSFVLSLVEQLKQEVLL